MKFSQRTNWPRHLNRLSEELERLRRSGTTIHDLTISNPTECGFHYPEEAILTALSDRSCLSYHPEPNGTRSAREAIADFYRELDVAVDPSHIVVTSGSSEAYSHLFRLLCNPGDSVLVPTPSYPLFEYIGQLNDADVRSCPLVYDHGWHIDLAEMKKAVTSNTRAIILINPHNPTGMFVKSGELHAIIRIANEIGAALIVDEVFSAYGYESSPERVATTANVPDCLTFTINGISKLCGLPQLKLGWIAVSGPAIVSAEALARLEIINDTYLSANTPAQIGLGKLLRAGTSVRGEIRKRCAENRAYLASRVGGNSSCSLLESEGGWSAILKIPAVKSEEEWALEILRQTGILVYPGYFFDFPSEGYLVVSLLVGPEEFRRSAESLLRWIDSRTTASP